MSSPRDLMTCGVCGTRLNWHQSPQGDKGFVHPTWVTDDHPAVPVTEAEINAREACDFCLSFEVVTEWHAPGTTVMVPRGEFMQVDAEDGRWCACEPCARLLRKKDAPALLRRVGIEHRKRFGPTTGDPGAVLAATYKHLIKRGREVGRS